MNDHESVALTFIPRSKESHNSIKCLGGAPSNVIYFSFLALLVLQYIRQCLPYTTKIPIIDLIIPHAFKNNHIILHTF